MLHPVRALRHQFTITAPVRALRHIDRTLNISEQHDLFVENTPWRNTLQEDGFSRMEIREILAVNLRKLRRARGLSQEELAHRAEIDRTYISSLERSVYAAGIDVVERLARALDVEVADLLTRPTPSKKKPSRAD